MKNPLEGFDPLAYQRPIVSVKTLGVQVHSITDPQGIQAVLGTYADHFTKAPIDARILAPATKQGLLSVHAEQWRKQRKAMAPIFKHRHMAVLAPSITEVIHEFKSRLG